MNQSAYRLVSLSSDHVAVVFLGSSAPKAVPEQSGNRIVMDLDGDGVREVFRECASMEGIHYFVWTGEVGSGRRRWHAYFYMGYDLESNCTDEDFGTG